MVGILLIWKRAHSIPLFASQRINSPSPSSVASKSLFGEKAISGSRVWLSRSVARSWPVCTSHNRIGPLQHPPTPFSSTYAETPAKVLLSGEKPSPTVRYSFELERVTRGGVIVGCMERMMAVVPTTNSNRAAASSLYWPRTCCSSLMCASKPNRGACISPTIRFFAETIESA
jgi:hypothetical protein